MKIEVFGAADSDMRSTTNTGDNIRSATRTASGTPAVDRHEALYRTVEVLKDVDEHLRAGGPAMAKNQWIEGFVAFCEQNHLPADFVGTHHYPTDVSDRSHDVNDCRIHLLRRRRAMASRIEES